MNSLKKMAEIMGISSSYIDKVGIEHYTTDEIRKFFLKSMGLDSFEKINEQISKLSKTPLLPDVMSFYENEDIVLELHGCGKYEIFVRNEEEKIVYHNVVEGRNKIKLEGLNFGYYKVEAIGKEKAHSMLIYAPTLCYQPDFIINKERLYGVSVMLYALRSKDSMGIGDFADLAEIVRITAQNGGDIVGINPLGVMSPYIIDDKDLYKKLRIDQCDVSPYRTISRLFVNYIYLRLQNENDFKSSTEINKFISENKDYCDKLNNSELVMYKEVLLFKLKILEMMFEQFKKTPDNKRKEQFADYIKEKGDMLQNLCLFEVLAETQTNSHFWCYWENNYDDISSVETEKFKLQNSDRIEFYAYCHWLADLQIKKVQELAKTLNMKIGIYSDMPIGAASNGVEVWENTKAYVLDAGIGAPADPMRPKGQSWGFTPYHPLELKKQHYAPFIKLVRENMQYSGALRIDHAMGLRRLFWGFFEDGNPVVQGAYVYYDIKDLTAILSVESNRQKCLLIGEDLGTVPSGFREYMAEHGLLSYKVFFRQKEKNGEFIVPENYQYLSLAQPSTHDQATAYGFWKNNDIEEFNNCGLYVNDEQYQANLEGRKQDCENMVKAFEKQNMNISNVESELHLLVNEYGAKTQSALFLVRLCDIYKQVVLDNAPGTVFEYPNWRIKLSKTVEDIKNTTDFADMMRLISKYRQN
ncbi:MAG: 4-alpha-glucanotransferase [Alphaproteobacteria bacterium]|nr:4-alpha-glucanotransferase [Alphaproteobacteria bacterium]